MSDDHSSPEYIAAVKKKYWGVFGVLMVGTLLTVAMYSVYFEQMWVTVGVALLIATFKATCVAAIFMHLWGEKKIVYHILFATVFFCIGLMGLTLWAMNDAPYMTHWVK
ncbi:MAG: cytochrome C oxidase subunit IV family protein [Verrucomicrobiia bacterium]|jgi:caa(3)-type oxidase subunit IV